MRKTNVFDFDTSDKRKKISSSIPSSSSSTCSTGLSGVEKSGQDFFGNIFTKEIGIPQLMDEDTKSFEDNSGNINSHEAANSSASDSDTSDPVDDFYEERTAIRQELSNLTYEELEELKQKMGLTLYNEAMFGTKSSKKRLSKKKQTQLFKRENKNRPREISSRAHVPKVQEVIHVKKVVKRDPRFDDSCGELNKDLWDKNYDFLRDMQQKEVQGLKKSLKHEQDEERRIQVKKYIQTFKNKEKSKAASEKEIQKRKSEKEDNMKRMAEGKNPFYMKKSTRKFLDLAEKYEELKASGKLEKYLKKKRKKNQTRDRKAVITN